MSLKHLLNIGGLLIGLHIFPVLAQPQVLNGQISGELVLDSAWQRLVYLSFIEDFDAMYTMSNQMIIQHAVIDPQGQFSFDLSALPETDHLYRLHFVKEDDPPATIIIGDNEENHVFLIANRFSQITLSNTSEKNLISEIKINSPTAATFEVIRNIAHSLDDAGYYNTGVSRTFKQKALEEKYRYIADTCQHSLLSLYAVYQSDYETNYQENQLFYNQFSERWTHIESPYFTAFRNVLPPPTNSSLFYYVLTGGLCLSCLVLGLFLGGLRKSKKQPNLIQKLSIQERKIFSLLQQGASNQDIAEVHHIGMSTVKSHVSNIYAKLKIKSRKEAMNIKI